jgi:phosphoserine phosphatase
MKTLVLFDVDRTLTPAREVSETLSSADIRIVLSIDYCLDCLL